MIKPLDNPIPASKYNEEIERKRLRDQFAGRAMERLLGDLRLINELATARGSTYSDIVAEMSWEVADSMMKKRNAK